MSERTRAVVLGGSIAGMLAAAALRPHVDVVTVVERDRVPAKPDLRQGLPQARHAHLLWSGGARVIESLLPGTTERILNAGGHRLGVYRDMVSLTSHGWQHRFPSEHFMIACTRPLIDWVVRDQALSHPQLEILDGTEVTGLMGSGVRITGARTRDRESGASGEIDADLVVEASGRGSQLRKWLAGLGLPEVREDVVDSGIAYATRIFRAPEDARQGFPIVSVYADHRTSRPGQNVVLLPVEDGQWMITASGTRGGEPPVEEAAFDRFVRGVRDPLVADLIAGAEPLTEVQGTRSTANKRRFYERLGSWPEGLVVLGDALAAFNPVYGHGMSAAARCAAALGLELRQRRLTPGMARRAQQAIARVVDDPWSLAISQDIFYPDCRIDVADPGQIARIRSQRQFADIVTRTAISDPLVGEAVAGVTTLSAPLNSLEDPKVVTALRAGPSRPRLTRPQLGPGELALRG